MKSLETHLTLLRQHNLKITPQRRLIVELLLDDESHPTVDAIYQRVLAAMPGVSRTTVYNTLHELVTLGILAEVPDLSEGGVRYDTNAMHHHHLFCIQCHALVDVSHSFEGVSLSSEEAAGYQIIQSQVTFYGICPTCQNLETE